MRPLLAILLGALLGATLPALPFWVCGPGEPLTCYAEGLGEPPLVTVEGGTGGLANCEDDGAGALRCVVWAQGAWRRVVAGGRVIARRCPCAYYFGMVSGR